MEQKGGCNIQKSKRKNKDHCMINLNIAHHKITLWILAFVITISSAIYQRRTGPTYPKRGQVEFQGNEISFRLLRSQNVTKDIPIMLTVADTSIGGYAKFKRLKKSSTEWSKLLLERKGDSLVVDLPHGNQEAAEKLMYFVYLTKNNEQLSLTGTNPVTVRFTGKVPDFILITHILFMFLAMFLSNRAGLEALDEKGKAYKYMLWTIGFFLAGGFILGPVMQKYAFGYLWTGFPFGIDLTDNKSLVAMLGWIGAWIKNRKGKEGRGWIIFAAILMLAVYLIPHSLLGSEKIPE